MLVKQAQAVARQWVQTQSCQTPAFVGAFSHGSINWLADDAPLSPTSDVDIMLVLDESNPQMKLGKFVYQDVLLEVSYLPVSQFQSPEYILGQYNLAGSFHKASILSDPSGRLTALQAAVSRDYAKRCWVYRRCEQARDKVLAGLHRLNESEPFDEMVTTWLFATGVSTHILLVAGLRNPTVRRRYVAVRDLLTDYGYRDFHETLLEALGCVHMTQAQVEGHLPALAEVFDAAQSVVKTPFFFASDISPLARPIAIDGSRDMIARGNHREAMFWIVATYSRCQQILAHDAPATMQDRFRPAYRHLLRDLGITSYADLQRRSAQVQALLPRVWEVAEAIIAAHPDIED